MTKRSFSTGDVDHLEPSRLREMISALAGVPPLGLEANEPGFLMPVNLRVDTTGKPHFRWDGIDLHRVTEMGSADECLWDFVAVAESIKAGVEAPVVLAGFFNKWGVLDYGHWGLEVDGHFTFIEPIVGEALQVRAMLKALVESENGDLIDDDTYIDLINEDPFGMFENVGDSLRKIHPAEFQPIVQNLMIDECISKWIRTIDIRPSCDTGTRRVFFAPRGAREVIGYALLTLYTSPDVDVFSCSVCGRMYRLQLKDGQRRPRSGTRRYCGKDCRVIGNRESKRSSYHRRKASSQASVRS